MRNGYQPKDDGSGSKEDNPPNIMPESHQKIITGKWLDNNPSIWVQCSNCLCNGFAHYDYCPWCGSKNRGD